MKKKTRNTLDHPEAGYNLVELAIVLVVIGLIAGGTMKGLELIDNAKVKSISTQINEYRLAATLFMDRYGALPGDYDQASTNIDSKLRDGDNSGTLEGYGLDYAATGTTHKAASFWQHLAAAKMIQDPGRPENQRMTFGKGAPTTKIGGGITIENNPSICPDCEGMWFLVGKENGVSGTKALLTPKQARLLNQALDNGDPQSGSVRSVEGYGVAAGKCIQNGRYNTSVNSATCLVLVQF